MFLWRSDRMNQTPKVFNRYYHFMFHINIRYHLFKRLTVNFTVKLKEFYFVFSLFAWFILVPILYVITFLNISVIHIPWYCVITGHQQVVCSGAGCAMCHKLLEALHVKYNFPLRFQQNCYWSSSFWRIHQQPCDLLQQILQPQVLFRQTDVGFSLNEALSHLCVFHLFTPRTK